jgi:hypothetical protein
MANNMQIDPIKAGYFYNTEDEKTKLNWFCYEYAFFLYKNIMDAKKLARYRKKNNHEQIVSFCVYFSKEMKHSIHEKLGGLVEHTTFYEEYVEKYYPNNTSRENYFILNIAAKAWDELLSNCVNCPARCISEMNKKSILFDQLDEAESL